jgi:hypothetical protein
MIVASVSGARSFDMSGFSLGGWPVSVVGNVIT